MLVARMYFVVILAIFLGIDYGCATISSSEMKKNDWYTGIPQSVSDLAEWRGLESDKVHVVIPAMLPKAYEELKINTFKKITHKQTSELLGYEPSHIANTKLFLVRSVLINEKTGGYYVSTLNGNLWVHHGSLGRKPVDIKRRALVLQLKEVPQQVYVTCSIAE